jgi:3-dehydroquinate dehydratase/shikimate dehydrogenase
MTLLVATIAASTPEQATADMAVAVKGGAEAVELRVDYLASYDDVVLRSIAAARPEGMPLILTVRAKDEGGVWDAEDDERVARLTALSAEADYLDVEYATWQRRPDLSEALRHALHDETGERRRRLILSAHDLSGRPVKLWRLAADMADVPEADAIKIAWHARTVRDNLEAFELMDSLPSPGALMCMGEAGGLSRILARKYEAFATYAAVSADRTAAPGQLTLDQLRHEYRWEAIGPATRVYGVIGHPVKQSLSPAVHNAAFEQAGIDAVYVPLDIAPGYESFKAFAVDAASRTRLGLSGLSVTTPHKENALRFVRERQGEIEPACERVGAVNTLSLDTAGRWSARNTDLPALRESIRRLLGRPKGKLTGLRCAILGAGGIARTAASFLLDAGASVRVYNRSVERGRALAESLGCEADEWESRLSEPADLVVNCTSVGLWPKTDESPLPLDALRPEMAVFDTIYNPIPTRLVREALSAGCRAEGGLAMFVEQAALQFEAWTGGPAPREVMRAAAQRGLLRYNE